jgi:hypothetical protein
MKQIDQHIMQEIPKDKRRRTYMSEQELAVNVINVTTQICLSLLKRHSTVTRKLLDDKIYQEAVSYVILQPYPIYDGFEVEQHLPEGKFNFKIEVIRVTEYLLYRRGITLK